MTDAGEAADATGIAGTVAGHLALMLGRPVAAGDRARAMRHLLDWAGCALAASAEPAAAGFRHWAAVQGQGAATALGAGSRPAEAAAFVNGALGNMLEMDDLHRASILHAGDVVLPAALAAAEEAGADGAALLDAVTLGYEAAIRVGRVAAAGGYSAWYNSATCGVFGAAAAAARVFGAGPADMADAFGHAGMQAAGLWQCRLDPGDGKQLATAHAARAGVAAARLARAGLRGPARIFEGELGFFATLYPGTDPSQVLAAPDVPWALHEVSFKPWPACRHTHPAIAAALHLRAALPPEEIARVQVATYAAGLAFCDAPHPASDHAARFSLQHAVAVTLLRGAPGLDAFRAAARDDPAVAALRARVHLAEDGALSAAFPGRMGARVSVVPHSGPPVAHSVATAPGDPEDPLNAADLHAKFHANAAAAGCPPDRAQALADAIASLADAPDLDALSTALRAAAATLSPPQTEPADA